MEITIITAVYNNRPGIERAMESLFSQTYKDYELIVVDGGSQDGTVEVLKRYGDKVAKLVSEPDSGIYDALNKGLRLATGEVVGFLHSDDILDNDHVLEKMAALFQETEADGIYGDLQYVSAHDSDKVVRHWRSQSFASELLGKGWMPPHPTFYIKRKWYTTYGLFDTKYTIAADYDLMLRFLEKEDFKAYYLPEVIVKMSLGGISNRSLKSIWKKSMEDLEIIHRHRLGGWGTLVRKNLSKVGQFMEDKR